MSKYGYYSEGETFTIADRNEVRFRQNSTHSLDCNNYSSISFSLSEGLDNGSDWERFRYVYYKYIQLLSHLQSSDSLGAVWVAVRIPDGLNFFINLYFAPTLMISQIKRVAF